MVPGAIGVLQRRIAQDHLATPARPGAAITAAQKAVAAYQAGAMSGASSVLESLAAKHLSVDALERKLCSVKSCVFHLTRSGLQLTAYPTSLYISACSEVLDRLRFLARLGRCSRPPRRQRKKLLPG